MSDRFIVLAGDALNCMLSVFCQMGTKKPPEGGFWLEQGVRSEDQKV